MIMRRIFFSLIILITAIISISLLPPPLTSTAGTLTATITLSKIANSCIVNNTNIALQNANSTPIDATNNWWGMPRGASDQNRSAGDLVGQNVVYEPHLPIMPLLCDLADADWIPFNEQELQHAINQNIPYLRGIGFALIDIEWGSGAKFTIVSKPDYDDVQGEAFISITPSPDGTFMNLMIDLSRTNSQILQIASCELMPLFLNSLQQVQNRYVAPSQNIQQMVVMDSSIMMQFSPLIEITLEPAPEIVMNYDTSCLPPISDPMPTPTPPPLEGGMGLITIPPIEGEIGLMEVSQPTIESLTLSYYGRYRPLSNTISGSYLDFYPASTVASGGAVPVPPPLGWNDDAGAVNHRRTWGGYAPNTKSVEYNVPVIDMTLGNISFNHHVKVNRIEVVQAFYGNCATTTWKLDVKLIYEDDTTATYTSDTADLAPTSIVFDTQYPFRLYQIDVPDNDKYVKKLIVNTVNTCSNPAGNLYIEYRLQDVRVDMTVFGSFECPTPPLNLAGTMSATQNIIPEICQEPPSPPIENEPVFCLGLSSTNGVINIRQYPDVLSDAVEEGFAIGSTIGIIGVYIDVWGRVSRSNPEEGFAFFDWYYVEFTGSNNIINRGWIRGEVIGSTRGCGDIPRYDATGVPLQPPIYDYRLPPPPENVVWYNSEWVIRDNRNNPQISSVNPPIIDGDECQSEPPTTEEAVKSHRACAKIVYYVYYQILSRIDTGQSLMLSRLIGTIYQNELKFQEDNDYLEEAEKAIKANYWIVCNNSTNYPSCRDDITKIHETNPEDLANIYLASMEAWYGKAFELLKWYWVLENDNLPNFTTLQELESIFQGDIFKLNGLNTLKLLLLPEFDNILVGENVLQSDTYGANDPWWWGNYGYGSPEYIQFKASGHPNIVYCIIVRQFDDIGSSKGFVDSGDFWTDYIFALINIRNIGQTSNHNKYPIPREWVPEPDTGAKIPIPVYERC